MGGVRAHYGPKLDPGSASKALHNALVGVTKPLPLAHAQAVRVYLQLEGLAARAWAHNCWPAQNWALWLPIWEELLELLLGVLPLTQAICWRCAVDMGLDFHVAVVLLWVALKSCFIVLLCLVELLPGKPKLCVRGPCPGVCWWWFCSWLPGRRGSGLWWGLLLLLLGLVLGWWLLLRGLRWGRLLLLLWRGFGLWRGRRLWNKRGRCLRWWRSWLALLLPRDRGRLASRWWSWLPLLWPRGRL